MSKFLIAGMNASGELVGGGYIRWAGLWAGLNWAGLQQVNKVLALRTQKYFVILK